MEQFEQFNIPCPHVTQGLSWEVRHANYYPLTLVEIAELLQIARTATDWRVVNAIQLRFDRGIVGMECPQNAATAAYHQMTLIDRLYVTSYHLGAEPWLVQKLYDVMNHTCTTL